MENMDHRYEKRNPFAVPEHYFDELSERIMQRVAIENRQMKKNHVRFFRPYVKWVAIIVVGFGSLQTFRMVMSEELHNKGEGAKQTYVSAAFSESLFDRQFNPTSEEIIEYLTTEVNDYEGLIAGIY